MSAIPNWVLEGCLDWQDKGLNPRQIAMKQVSVYKTDLDGIAQLVEQEFVINPERRCFASEIFEAHRYYCQA